MYIHAYSIQLSKCQQDLTADQRHVYLLRGGVLWVLDHGEQYGIGVHVYGNDMECDMIDSRIVIRCCHPSYVCLLRTSMKCRNICQKP